MTETLPVYVFSNGDVANKVFEALATFLGGNDFVDMLAILSIIAVIMTGILIVPVSDTNLRVQETFLHMCGPTRHAENWYTVLSWNIE